MPQHSARQSSSLQTPSFMQPTSSSTARRSTISNASTALPTSLTSQEQWYHKYGPTTHRNPAERTPAERAHLIADLSRRFPQSITYLSRIPRSTTSLAAATANPSCNAARSKVDPASTAPQVMDNGGGEIDLTVIRGAQDRRFWAGRYTATSDRIRNDLVTSPTDARYANSDEQHQRSVLQYLDAKCADEEARESLNAFVRAWKQGWTRGTADAFLGVAPDPVVPARLSMTEEKKKGGFMGKMFGHRKS
ncbi:MAG: hypothetical protein Q9221_005356 [Calogaya cf. arnoldii]